jgi:exodeoxyribonuclease VII large subunit
LRSVLSLRRENLEKLGGMLMTADPLATLDRGYSIVLKLPDKSVIETIGSIDLGDDVLVMVRDGEIHCVVKNLKEVERRPRK